MITCAYQYVSINDVKIDRQQPFQAFCQTILYYLIFYGQTLLITITQQKMELTAICIERRPNF